MSNYSKYLAEKTDCNIIEDERGFATYRFTSDSVYIVDIYVSPDFRHHDIASQMADKIGEIAKEKGIRKMLGSVNINTKDPTSSLKVLLAYGFKVNSSTTNFLLLEKDL
jgi:ribosomal protein S18 acetylase RimI-like enzyme